MRRFALSLVCLSAFGCVEPEAFHCDRNEDCISSAGMGWCEPTSYCSYAEPRCASGRRYSDLAGPFAGECVVPGENDSAITVADDTSNDGDANDDAASDESMGDESATDEAGETGENGDDPLPTDAHLVWSRLVSHPSGGSDRFLAVALADDRIVAAGQQLGDLSFVALAPGNGDVLTSLIHHVGGSDDAVHSFVPGTQGELVA
ncbi:MAG TPA: hypothetical protein VG755_12190, partial [Nannocystaceae bacterium]|nr:hypothetical protein [Nannocystaceae bacterium]